MALKPPLGAPLGVNLELYRAEGSTGREPWR